MRLQYEDHFVLSELINYHHEAIQSAETTALHANMKSLTNEVLSPASEFSITLLLLIASSQAA